MSALNTLSNEDIQVLNILRDSGIRKWIETVLIDPTTNKPVVLNYPQIAALETSNKKWNYICVHRRAGKTWLLAAIALYYACNFESIEINYYTNAGTQIREFFKDLDNFVAASPLCKAFADTKDGTNLRSPSMQIRSFFGGSSVQGYVLNEGKRGNSPDVVFIDEAQDLTEAEWAIVHPMADGGHYKRDTVKVFITGTVKDAHSVFVSAVLEGSAPKKAVTLVPVDKNPDYTKEILEEIRESAGEYIYRVEWLLIPSSSANSVFQTEWFANCESTYNYGTHNIVPEHYRILTADWDKYQAGSHILISQYDPISQELLVIHSEIVPQTKFTLSRAAERCLTLYTEYIVDFIYCDKGYGEVQWEYIIEEGLKAGITDIETRCKAIALNGADYFPNITNPSERVKKMLKPMLVSLVQDRLRTGKLKYSITTDTSDYKYSELKRHLALYKYKRNQFDSSKIRFSSQDEHFVDCILFAEYCIFKEMGNILERRKELSLFQISQFEEVPLSQGYSYFPDWEGYRSESNPYF